MSVSTNDLKNGMALDLPQEGLVTVVEFQHVKPGKGGAFVRTKLKRVAGGAVLERTFRADEKVPLAMIDKREMQYLFRESDALVFMDNETYDQISFPRESLGTQAKFLVENMQVLGVYVDGNIKGIDLPPNVVVEVVSSEPGVKGDSVSNMNKKATHSTGMEVSVPLFVKEGDIVRVDTRTGQDVERVKQER